MAVQPTYGGALKGIGHPHSFAQIPGGYLQMGQEQGLRIRRYSLSGETSAR